MKPDPIIDEIRRVRHQISAECGHDPKRLLEYYLELERKLKETGEFRFADAPSTGSGAPTQSAPSGPASRSNCARVTGGQPRSPPMRVIMIA